MKTILNRNKKMKLNYVRNMKREKDLHFCLPVSSSCAASIKVEQRDCINLISNNYLGFSTHPKVVEAVQKTQNEYGIGMGGSPVMCGTTAIHQKLKERLAAIYKMEDAAIFPSGYQAMLGAIQSAVSPGDIALLDSFAHRSLIDGAILSCGNRKLWSHNNAADLEKYILATKEKYDTQLVVVDSVYSMEGDLADLPAINKVRKRHDSLLMIDEAHSLGVLGENGHGLLEHFNYEESVDIVSGTFSKFAGSVGGFVVGDKDFIEYINFYSSAFVFSASLPPHVCAGVLKAIELLEEEPEWRERLWENVGFLSESLSSLGFDIGSSETAVIPLMIRDGDKTFAFNKMIFDKGVFTSAVFHPGVPLGEERLRLGLTAKLNREDLEKVVDIFAEAGKKLELI